MAKDRDWQERGLRIGGRLLTTQEVHLLVQELRKRVDDPEVVMEMEEVLLGKRKVFSQRAQTILTATIAALLMMTPPDLPQT